MISGFIYVLLYNWRTTDSSRGFHGLYFKSFYSFVFFIFPFKGQCSFVVSGLSPFYRENFEYPVRHTLLYDSCLPLCVCVFRLKRFLRKRTEYQDRHCRFFTFSVSTTCDLTRQSVEVRLIFVFGEGILRSRKGLSLTFEDGCDIWGTHVSKVCICRYCHNLP